VQGIGATGMKTDLITIDGSTTLVLQTVLPALLTADGLSHPCLEGGTHNPLAVRIEIRQTGREAWRVAVS